MNMDRSSTMRPKQHMRADNVYQCSTKGYTGQNERLQNSQSDPGKHESTNPAKHEYTLNPGNMTTHHIPP